MTPEYIVDGMPVYITRLQLDPEEIESMTFIRDIADKALLGSRAADGVLYITTRRGRTHGRSIRVGFESGVSVVDRFPEWVNGVEYTQLQTRRASTAAISRPTRTKAIENYARKGPLRPDLSERRLPDDDVQGHEALLQSQRHHRRRHPETQYSAYVGYAGEGDIYKVGSKADFNRVNVRTYLKSGRHAGPPDRPGIQRRDQFPPPAPLRLRRLLGHGVRKRSQPGHHNPRDRVSADRLARRGDGQQDLRRQHGLPNAAAREWSTPRSPRPARLVKGLKFSPTWAEPLST